MYCSKVKLKLVGTHVKDASVCLVIPQYQESIILSWFYKEINSF